VLSCRFYDVTPYWCGVRLHLPDMHAISVDESSRKPTLGGTTPSTREGAYAMPVSPRA
jgi:hypothetical protein